MMALYLLSVRVTHTCRRKLRNQHIVLPILWNRAFEVSKRSSNPGVCRSAVCRRYLPFVTISGFSQAASCYPERQADFGQTRSFRLSEVGYGRKTRRRVSRLLFKIYAFSQDFCICGGPVRHRRRPSISGQSDVAWSDSMFGFVWNVFRRPKIAFGSETFKAFYRSDG